MRDAGIASNALWPRTLIATAAVQNLLGGDAAMAASRKPELYADAAYAIVTRPSRECTGNTYLCEDVLVEEGVTDFAQYTYVQGGEPQVDLFVDASTRRPDDPAARSRSAVLHLVDGGDLEVLVDQDLELGAVGLAHMGLVGRPVIDVRLDALDRPA